MLIEDLFLEIWEALKRKPARTILTSVGISWGIFILILLVGIGSGFERGVFKLFGGYAKSATYVIATQTEKSYKGTNVGQKINFELSDIELLKKNVPDIQYISPELSNWNIIHSGMSVGSFEIRAVFPEYFHIKLIEADEGRMLNHNDMSQNRKCVVIGKNVADVLFKRQHPIGKKLQIKGETYNVVGIIKSTILSANEERVIYVPYSTYLLSDAYAKSFSAIVYSTKNDSLFAETKALVNSHLCRAKVISPDDKNAFYFSSMEEQVEAFRNFFDMLRKFLWFMGISTLISGIVGVANIMYIAAKERTREIGIRKALGAKPSQIKSMFIYESIALTIISGVIGIIGGWLCLIGIGLFIDDDTPMMDKPNLELITTISAMIVLVISGTASGITPALYASALSPIDALKEEI